jgi:hypothetical protein
MKKERDCGGHNGTLCRSFDPFIILLGSSEPSAGKSEERDMSDFENVLK